MSLAIGWKLLAGLALLLLGAEGLVRGAAALARRFGVSPLVVGLTVVAFGTSTPELLVSVNAALVGAGDIAMGNVVGSNIANILLVLGLAAIVRPLQVQAKVVRLDIPIAVGVSLAVLALANDGRVGRLEGLALVAAFTVYVGISVVLAGRERSETVLSGSDRGVSTRPHRLAGRVAMILVGLSLLLIGSDLFVRGAVGLASALHVPEAWIGLTIVAVGTSLPELTTSLVAAARGESDIAVGNVVGSNIFNLLAILGASALVRPIRIVGVTALDCWVMVGAAVLLVPFARSGLRLRRGEAFVFLLAYGVYLYVR